MVNVTYDTELAGRGADILDDLVYDEDVEAVVTKTDGLTDPDLLAAEVKRVVEFVIGVGRILGDWVKRSKGWIDLFRAEDTAVDFHVTVTISPISHTSPVYIAVCESGG